MCLNATGVDDVLPNLQGEEIVVHVGDPGSVTGDLRRRERRGKTKSGMPAVVFVESLGLRKGDDYRRISLGNVETPKLRGLEYFR